MSWQQYTPQVLFLKTAKSVEGTETFLPVLVCEGVSLCVFKSGYVCLGRALYWWPLITQSILIQSASFSHDCHTLTAAAMVTCRGRRESARLREVRCLFFNHCDIYTHIIIHMDTSTLKFLFLVSHLTKIFAGTRTRSVQTVALFQMLHMFNRKFKGSYVSVSGKSGLKVKM